MQQSAVCLQCIGCITLFSAECLQCIGCIITECLPCGFLVVSQVRIHLDGTKLHQHLQKVGFCIWILSKLSEVEKKQRKKDREKNSQGQMRIHLDGTKLHHHLQKSSISYLNLFKTLRGGKEKKREQFPKQSAFRHFKYNLWNKRYFPLSLPINIIVGAADDKK